MKRFLLPMVLMVMLCAAASPTIAASPSAASPSGRGTTTHRFTTSPYYDFVLGGTVICSGIHQDGPRWPGDAVSGGRDVFHCRSISGPFTNASPGELVLYPAFRWFSDYFAEAGVFVRNTQPLRGRIAGDGRSYHAIAYYFE